MEIVEGGNEQASVTPTAVAGVVSFEISNPTDGYHGVQINRMLPGVTIEEVRADALELARTGAESSNLEEDPLLGVVNGPHDHFVTAIPLEAGEYAVLLTTTDESFAGAPDADGHGVRQLTITTGSAGSAPTPTLTFDRIAEDGLIGPTTAPPDPATIRVDNTVAGSFQFSLVELPADATQHDFELWAQNSVARGGFDWSTSPAATVRAFCAGAAPQTVTVDLDGGDLRVDARPSFDQGGAFSVVWVTVN